MAGFGFTHPKSRKNIASTIINPWWLSLKNHMVCFGSHSSQILSKKSNNDQERYGKGLFFKHVFISLFLKRIVITFMILKINLICKQETIGDNIFLKTLAYLVLALLYLINFVDMTS